MKTLFKTVIATIIVMLFVIAGMASAQDTTSVFELKLYNTQNKLVPGKDVDLYQSAVKKYDLAESSSVPGVYSATVRHGEYDIYVGGSTWKSGIWIGSNKISLMADLFYFDGSGAAILRADTLYGDGSNLTGISGSVADAPDDLLLNADANEDRVGDIEFVLADTVRGAVKLSTVKNQTSLIIGRYVGSSISGAGAAGFDPVMQLQVDSTGTISVARVYDAGSGARYAFLQVDDYLNRIVSGSTETGNPTGADLWPYDLIAGAQTSMRIDTLGNVVIQGTANNRTAAGFAENLFQLQTDDTTGTISVAQISGSGARYALLQVQDILQRIIIGSTDTGDPDGADLWPVSLIAGAQTVLSLDTLENVVIQGTANDRVAAGYTHDVFQVHADTSVGMQAVRIYDSGARYAGLEVDEINNIVKVGSFETGTAPGDTAYRMVFWVGGAGGNKMEIYPSGVVRMNGATVTAADAGFIAQSYATSNATTGYILRALNQAGTERFSIRNDGNVFVGSLLLSPSFGISDNGYGGYVRVSGSLGAINLVSANNANIDLNASGTGKIVHNDLTVMVNPIELQGGAWFGATRDTIDAMIPCVSFDDDTAFYDMGVFPHAVSVDSLWLDILTTDTDGDSSRFVLGHRQVDFGESYTGAFTSQSSSYADMGGGDVRVKARFTTAISLDANHRLLLKLYRDNAIDNNTAGRVKLAGAIVFGKGLK